MENEPIYVFGHKNPDADAICAPIAYANYRSMQGHNHYVPARCGNTNSRIDAILARFNQPAPRFVSDVIPRVSDIMNTKMIIVKESDTSYGALELIDQHDVRTLPVLDDDGCLKGMVSIFQFGEFFIPKPSEARKMRLVNSSIDAIVRSLRAEVIYKKDADRNEELFVRVAAMQLDSFGSFSKKEKIPAAQSIIIVGDRKDVQLKAIEMGVRLIIITGGLDVDDEVVEASKKAEISLVVSPSDSATTSWIVRTATLVKTLLSNEVVTFGPNEKLSQVKRKVSKTYSPIYFVVDESEKLVGLFSRADLLKPVKTKIAMLDHNELSQSVNGADEVNVVEVIDHHRLGNPPSDQPILFKNMPWGSTCSIIADMFQNDSLTPSPDIAGIMMSGIISDTLHLTGPTTTDRDVELLKWLSEISGIDSSELAQNIFSSGSVILNTTPEKAVDSDCKIYHDGDTSYSVAQIEELGFDNFWKNSTKLVHAVESYRAQNQLLFSALLVTDINTHNSLFIIQGDPEIKKQVLYPEVEADTIFEMQGIVSRKKQLIPYLSNLLKAVRA